MRIGIVPDIDPSGPSGGVYQYSMTMLRALHEWTDSRCEDEFVVFSLEAPKSVLESLNGRGWTFKALVLEQSPSRQQKILDVLRGFVGEGPHREAWRSPGPRAAAGAHGDGVGPGDRTGAPDVPERILLILSTRGTLEVEPGRAGVTEVPDVAVDALLPRAARIDDDGVAAAVRDRRDHAPAAGAPPLFLPLRTG